MKFALFTSARGDYVGVRLTRLLDEIGVRAFIAAAIAVVVVVSVITFLVKTQ